MGVEQERHQDLQDEGQAWGKTMFLYLHSNLFSF